jgi:RNA polymerase sigma factor (TIGR02999 family)
MIECHQRRRRGPAALVCGQRADAADELIAVRHRHVDVSEDPARPLAAEQFQPLDRRRCDQHFRSAVFEQPPEGPWRQPFGPRDRFRLPGRQFSRGWPTRETVAIVGVAAATGRVGSPDTESTLNEVTRILSAVEQGDGQAASKLLTLVYDELRRLAAHRLGLETSGQTLQATALVHEAYLRLVDRDQPQQWKGRGHFFAAAAEAMRRILIENARGKARGKRGGEWRRVNFEGFDVAAAAAASPDQLLALDEALERLAERDPLAGELVKLRYFGGLALDPAAAALGISTATAYRHWAYARAWLCSELSKDA